MKIFKVDDNYLDFGLPDSIASQFSNTNIYGNDLDRKKKMYAIINMVNKTEKECNILSWGYDGIGINGNYYYFLRYVFFGNYLFEVFNYMDIKMARRYYKLIKLRNKL